MNLPTIDNFFQVFSNFSVNSEKYMPYNKGLSWNEYALIHRTNPIINKLVKMRKANIGANGWDIHCKMYASERKNERLATAIYDRLDREVKINKLIDQFAVLTGIYGDCYGVFNEDNLPIIQMPHMYNLYYDSINRKTRRLAMVIDGAEQKGELGNLQEGIDFYHFKEPDTTFKALADSPIDSCYGWILLYDNAVKINNNMISSGNVGALIALFEREMEDVLNQDSDLDDPGNPEKRKGMVQLRALREYLGGALNSLGFGQARRQPQSHKIAMLTGVKEFLQLSKNNSEMQLSELIDRAEESMYHAFGFNKTGKDSTYNNAKTFNYEQWDNVGKSLEEQFADYVNSFLLPKYGIDTGADFYFTFNPPNDPDEVENKKFLLTVLEKTVGLSSAPAYKVKVLNEFRDKIGLDMIDESLIEAPQPPVVQPALPDDNLKKNSQSEEFAASELTPTEKALKSKEYLGYSADKDGKKRVKKGFLPAWEKAITSQLNKFAENISGYDTVQSAIDNLEKELPKIETYYSFTALKKDMLKFAGMAIEEVQSRESFAETEFEYPQSILDLIDERTEALLKGNKEYKGIDAETASQLNSILSANLSKGIAEVISIIRESIPSIAESRAKLIAETEVSNVVEGSRHNLYKEAGYKYKRWLTVNDERVRSTHRANENQGVIEFGKTFANGNDRAGQEPRCRCTTIYGKSEDEIQ